MRPHVRGLGRANEMGNGGQEGKPEVGVMGEGGMTTDSPLHLPN